MKPLLPELLSLCTAALAVHATSASAQQSPLVDKNNIAKQDKPVPVPVPGHNDAIYDTIPKEEQLYSIEWFEMAPTPIETDRLIFASLNGAIPDSSLASLAPALLNDPSSLSNATITISTSAVYEDGTHEDEESYTIPLKSTGFGRAGGHLSIRDENGFEVEYLPRNGDSEIELEVLILAMFLESGWWTFRVDARLGDEHDTCLFAMKLTQWLEGSPGWTKAQTGGGFRKLYS
ncbi:hypothetical protein BDW74DRAFT_146434 [Aspergillus multicolor]|uniref:uncharacterized protein n=1 Tax=Aspergillus multicolor TaxID=41759 RepID=UPI003CCE00B1